VVAELTAKQKMRKIVDAMSEEEAERLLDYLNLLADPDELTEEELREVEEADARIDAGQYVTLAELREKYGV
jgi:hypothetical protein